MMFSSVSSTGSNRVSTYVNTVIEKAAPNSLFGATVYEVFALLLNAISLRQRSVLVQSKELNNNTELQNTINESINSIKFAVTPPGADEAGLAQVQNQNQNYSATRSNLQSILITVRQNGQIVLTNASTNVNIMQQLASQDSAFLKLMNSIGAVVNQLNQSPS